MTLLFFHMVPGYVQLFSTSKIALKNYIWNIISSGVFIRKICFNDPNWKWKALFWQSSFATSCGRGWDHHHSLVAAVAASATAVDKCGSDRRRRAACLHKTTPSTPGDAICDTAAAQHMARTVTCHIYKNRRQQPPPPLLPSPVILWWGRKEGRKAAATHYSFIILWRRRKSALDRLLETVVVVVLLIGQVVHYYLMGEVKSAWLSNGFERGVDCNSRMSRWVSNWRRDVFLSSICRIIFCCNYYST